MMYAMSSPCCPNNGPSTGLASTIIGYDHFDTITLSYIVFDDKYKFVYCEDVL